MKWNKELVLLSLQTFYDKYKEFPKQKDLQNKNNLPSVETIKRYFESCDKLYNQIDSTYLKYEKKKRWNKENVISSLNKFQEVLKRQITQEDLLYQTDVPSVPTIKQLFGSWEIIQSILGYKPTRSYTDEELLEILREKEIELRRSPRQSDFYSNENNPSASTISIRFKTWKNALEKAGLDSSKTQIHHFWTDLELLNLLVTKTNEYGRNLSYSDIDHDKSMPNPDIYRKRFGSLQKARKKAGVSWNKHRSRFELETELMIKQEFPKLFFFTNDREILNGLELDFYFPDLKIAIEINGPLHYKDIYGEQKFKIYQQNDKRKKDECNKKNIQLFSINIMGHSTSRSCVNQIKDILLEGST